MDTPTTTDNGVQHSLNSSRYLLPDGMPGVVILDATAHSNLLYALLEGTVYVVKVPGGIRDYGNVTLHVARTSAGLGKTKMKETKHLRLPRLAKELAEANRTRTLGVPVRPQARQGPCRYLQH